MLKPSQMRKLTCPECGSPMILIEGKISSSPFYGCTMFPKCRLTHGAHPDGKPLGVPATRLTVNRRKMAHHYFDMLWKSEKMSRGEAYSLLRRHLGLTKDQCHIGNFGIEQCDKVVNFAQEYIKNNF